MLVPTPNTRARCTGDLLTYFFEGSPLARTYRLLFASNFTSLLAEKVEPAEGYEACRKLGFNLLQG